MATQVGLEVGNGNWTTLVKNLNMYVLKQALFLDVLQPQINLFLSLKHFFQHCRKSENDVSSNYSCSLIFKLIIYHI